MIMAKPLVPFLLLALAGLCACASVPGRVDWISVGPLYASRDVSQVPAYSFSGLKKSWRAIGLVRSPLVPAENRTVLEAYVVECRQLAAKYGADAVVLKVVDKSQEPQPDGQYYSGPRMAYIWAVAVKYEENIRREKPVDTSVFSPEGQQLSGVNGAETSAEPLSPPPPAAPFGATPVEKAVEQLPFK